MKISLKGILLIAGAFFALMLAIGLYSGSGSSDIVLKERIFFKLKNSLDVTVADKSEGKVAEHMFQLSRSFTWTDGSGATRATARVAILTWGTEINVYDGTGNKVGSIEERVFSSLWKTWTAYDIKDANGKEIAVSDKTEWMGTTIILTAPDGTRLAKLDRPWINPMGDTWNITIQKPGSVDNRILVMIGAFKTAADRDSNDDSGSKNKGSGGNKK